MNKKIAFITAEYSEDSFTSGGIKLNYELILELLNRGYIIDVYSNKYFVKNDLVNNYFDFLEVKNKDLKAEYDIVISEKGVWASDITYIHDHSYKYRAKRINKTKITQYLYKIFAYKKHCKRMREDVNIKQNLDKTGKIVVSSSVLKQDMIENFGQSEDKLFMLPPAIKYDETASYRARQEKVVFGLSAIGLKRKGFYEVLDAVRKLKKINKNFLVKVIYPKAQKSLYLPILLKLCGVGKYIEFCPQQKNMNNFYRGIDYMLLPSRLEPFGMVATEAMSHYKPTLATSCCGACDVIVDKKLICTAENLHESMKNLIELSDEDYEKLAKDAFLKVQNMSWHDFCNKYLEILEK